MLRNTWSARATARRGKGAGLNLTTGNDDIDVGNSGVAGEGATIRIGATGMQARAFVAGLRGVATAIAEAIPVLVDSAEELGPLCSPRRFKQDIAGPEATARSLRHGSPRG